MLGPLLSTILLPLGLSLLPGAVAQDSNATCLSQNAWTINSRQQSPCLVSAYLQGACEPDGGWTVVALPNTSLTYVGPSASQASLCTCSSVTFSLISGCSFCQGGELPFWSDWVTNCPNSLVSNGQYPHAIPAGTAIPAWAYIPVNGTQWDPVGAKALAGTGAAESTLSQAQTPTPTPSSISSLSSSSSSSSPASPSPTHSSGSSNVGPIVGGVVGGVLGLAIIGLVAFFLYRYFNTKERASAVAPAPFIPPSTGPSPAIPEGKYPISPPTPNSVNPLINTAPPMKLYNPEDPTTFPTFQQDPSANNGFPTPQPHSPLAPNRYAQV